MSLDMSLILHEHFVDKKVPDSNPPSRAILGSTPANLDDFTMRLASG